MTETLNCKQNILHRIAIFMFSAWCFFLAWRNMLRLFVEPPLWYISLAAAAAAVLSIAFSFLAAAPLSKLKGWQIVTLLFAFSLMLKLLVVFTFAPAEYSDFQTFRAGAALTAKRDMFFITSLPYYSIWAYQFGFEWLISLIFRLFGRWDPVFGLVVNSFFAAGCTPALYGVVKEIRDKKTGICAALLFTLLPITINLSAVFTNQHLSLFFILLGLWILLKRPDWLGGLFSGFCLAIAKVARADVIVYIAAIAVAIILLKRSRKAFLALICCIAAYFAVFKAVEIIVAPLQPFGLGNNFPLYKFAVGLDETSSGRYSVRMQNEIFNNEAYLADHALRDEETMKLIKEELSIGPIRLIKLFLAKIDIQWTNVYHSYEMLHDIVQQQAVSTPIGSVSSKVVARTVMQWDSFSRMLLFAAAGLSGFAMGTKRKMHLGSSVLILALMAFSAIALVVEVQYRYTYFVFPAVCLAAAMLPRILFEEEPKED